MLNLVDKSINISSARLIASTGMVGFSSILACKLLIQKNNFAKIGVYFSEYTEHTITKLPNEYIHQGDVFYNKEKNIVIIFFIAGPPSYYKKQFFKELNEFVTKYQLQEAILTSGFLSEFQNDTEMRNPYVTPYYLSNGNNDSELKKSGIKSFVELCDLSNESKLLNSNLNSNLGKKPKELDEVEFLSASGFSSNYLKYQKKNKGRYTYVGSYVRTPLDVESGISLYIGLSNYLKLSVDDGILKGVNEIEKNEHVIKVKKNSLNDKLEMVTSLGIGKEWMQIVKST